MGDVIKNNRRVQLLCFGLAGIIFLLDIKLPLGVAGGVLYVLVVLLTWSYPKSFTFKIAWLCSFLTIIGLFLLPPGSELWIVLVNRFLALFVIWATAIMTHQYKRTEVALEKKKEKEQKYLDIAGVMFVALDANGNVTQINKMGCDIVGYSEDELLGKNWFDLCVPERTRAEIKTIFARVMAGETVEYKYFDNPVVTRNGEEKLLSWQNTVLRDENGRIIGSLSSGLDITERKKTSKSLKESEERFRSLIRSMDDMIYTLDREQKYMGVFGGWVLKNGFTPDFFLGKTAAEIWEHEVAAVHEAANKKALSGENVQYEWYYKNNSQETQYYLTALSPLKSASGKITGIVGVGRDITDRKKANDALQESEARVRAILETAVDAIITINENGIIESFNKAAEEIFGYTAKEAIGKNVNMLMPSPYKGDHDTYIRSYLKTGEKQIIGIGREVVGLRKDGTTFPIRIAVSEVVSKNRKLFTGIVRDITEQHNLQQKILQSERLAIIGKMAAKVAHEIRNPLSSISLNAELLEDEIQNDNGEAKSLLDSIIQEIDRVTALTDEYLQFSRLPESRLIRGDIAALINDIIEFLNEELKQKKIRCEFNNNSPSNMLKFDRTQFRRVLINIFRNAIDAMPKGGLLKIWIDKSDNKAIINIQDTGIGIAEDMIANIFSPFFTTKMFGTGLGLAITEQVVQEHGGQIYCNSKVNEGTTFRIVLPIEN